MTRVRALAGVTALGFALAACSSGDASTAHPPSSPADARTGGVLKVAIVTPGGIDPLNAYEPNGQLVSSTMCDTLVSIDPETGQLREALARSWVQTTDGGITVKTRRGLTFNDGKPFRSSDVNGSLQDLTAPSNASYVADLAKPFAAVAANTTTTQDVLADGKGDRATIATPLNHNDFQVQTVAPFGGALRAFAEPAMAPISQAAYDTDSAAFAANPVCVGPYRLAAPYHAGDKQIRLLRAAKYYGQNVGYTGGGKGYPDEIDFEVFANSAMALSAYLEGKVDVVRVTRDQAARVTAADDGDLIYGAATDVEFLGLPDGATGPLSNPNLRLALSEALDRNKIAATVFGSSSTPATGFLPPALEISTGQSLNGKTIKGAHLQQCGALTPATPDLAAARAALAKAAPISSLTLSVNSDAPYPALAAEVAKQWRALGLAVKVVTVPWSDYASAGGSGAGLPTAFRLRWSSHGTAPLATFNDQQSFLGSLLASTATAYGNWARWDNRDFDFGLGLDAAPLTDVQQRGFAMAKLAKVACQAMPIIPVVFDRTTYLVRRTKVGAARTLPMGRGGLLLLRELYLKD